MWCVLSARVSALNIMFMHSVSADRPIMVVHVINMYVVNHCQTSQAHLCVSFLQQLGFDMHLVLCFTRACSLTWFLCCNRSRILRVYFIALLFTVCTGLVFCCPKNVPTRLLGGSRTCVEALVFRPGSTDRTRFLDPTLLGIWSSSRDSHVPLSCDVWPRPMREDLCELGPSLGRFAGVLLPVLGDKASDSITIGAPHSVPRFSKFKNAANFEWIFDVLCEKTLRGHQQRSVQDTHSPRNEGNCNLQIGHRLLTLRLTFISKLYLRYG